MNFPISYATPCLKGCVALRAPSVSHTESWAILPSARITLTFGKVSNSLIRNRRQVLISDGSGLFWGGTQRTELAMRQSTSSSVSSMRSS